MVEPTRCGTASQDSAGDIFGLLARWRRLVRRGMQLVDFEPRWWSGGLIRVPRSGALLPSSLTAIPETCSERGAVQRGWRSLRTRERYAELRVGGPRARVRCPTSEVARPPRIGLLRTRCSSCRRAVSLGATTLRWWVLHGGDPLGAMVAAPLLLYQWWITSVVSIHTGARFVGGSCGYVLSPLSLL
jgi:hypothetical protein